MDTATAFNPTIQVPRGEDRGDAADLPPALVEAVRDDAQHVQPIARVFGVTVLHDMFKESGGYTPAQKRDFVDLCTRLGSMDARKVEAPQNAGAGYQLVINIGGSSSTLKGVTVDAQAELVTDASL